MVRFALSLLLALALSAPAMAQEGARKITGSLVYLQKIALPEGAEFGGAVAISGDTIVIGAPNDDQAGVASGSLFIYQREADGFWNLQRKMTASDASLHAQFGRSIVIDGDDMVVCSPYDDDNGAGSGSAYLFKRNDGGV